MKTYELSHLLNLAMQYKSPHSGGRNQDGEWIDAVPTSFMQCYRYFSELNRNPTLLEILETNRPFSIPMTFFLLDLSKERAFEISKLLVSAIPVHLIEQKFPDATRAVDNYMKSDFDEYLSSQYNYPKARHLLSPLSNPIYSTDVPFQMRDVVDALNSFEFNKVGKWFSAVKKIPELKDFCSNLLRNIVLDNGETPPIPSAFPSVTKRKYKDGYILVAHDVEIKNKKSENTRFNCVFVKAKEVSGYPDYEYSLQTEWRGDWTSFTDDEISTIKREIENKIGEEIATLEREY